MSTPARRAHFDKSVFACGFADENARGNAHQVGVGEFGAGALVAVVNQHLRPGSLRRGAELTPADVADLLDLDERQARRVVRDLDAAGPRLRVRTEGRRKFYGVAPEDLALLDTAEPLTEGEAFAIYMAVATARVPASNGGFSNTPMGPFHSTVLADRMARA